MGEGGGAYFISVLRQPHINVPFSYKYALLCVRTSFFPENKPPEAAHLPNTGVFFMNITIIVIMIIIILIMIIIIMVMIMIMMIQGQGPRPGPKKSAGPGPDPRRFFWVLPLVPGPGSS